MERELPQSHQNRDRPSVYGAVVGSILTKLEEIGRKSMPDLPPTCMTCAFREGSVPNMMPGTVLTALKCTMGTDPDPFGCHHGMKDGLPIKLCAGYYAAKHAFENRTPETEALILELSGILLDGTLVDTIRTDFDAWLMAIDPEGLMNNYQIARAYSSRKEKVTPTCGS